MKRALILAAALALVLPAAALAWGGTYATGDQYGSTVNVQVSAVYPVDDALPQDWATYLGTLVHGPEISKLTLQLLPTDELSRECGAQALACYDPANSTIYATPEDQIDEPPAKEVVTHEYGHHLANNMNDAPWTAEDWGTKRWSSYENICKKTEQGLASPGDEGRFYQQNPGEAFAEAYRVLNLTKQGATSLGWDIVDKSFYPDPTALQLLEQDVTSPWTGNTISHLAGTFGNGVVRTFTVKTALDGTFVASLKKPVKAKMTLALYSGAHLVAHGGTVRTEICGQRTLTLKVQRTAGAGAFTIAVSKP
jgi:hypothetical protein